MTPDRVLEISAIARRYGVTATTVRNWIRTGKLDAERTPSGRYRVRASALVQRKTKNTKESKDITGSI